MRPYKICIFICACLGILALISWAFPEQGLNVGETTIQWPSLSEALGQKKTETEMAAETANTTSQMRDSVAIPEPPVLVSWIDAFRQSLAQADSVPVHVMHYGDSQLEGDRMTMNLRRRFQQRYGGGGVGLIPLHQTIGMRTVYQTLTMNGEVQTPNGGPQRYMVYGLKSFRRGNNVYGPMGQVVVMNDSLVPGSEDLSLWVGPGSKDVHTERYFNRVRVLTAGNVTFSIQAKQVKSLGHGLYSVADSTTRCGIRFQGTGDVYGISLETDKGVTVSNIPMRGCAGTIFTGIRRSDLGKFYAASRTGLIILQYGGNTVPYTRDQKGINTFVSSIRAQIKHLRAAAPECSILFIGPSDMMTTVDGVRTTYPIIPGLDSGLKKMCEEEGCGYWSLFRAMGGKDSMLKWQENGLAGNDGVHFTRRGSDKAGEMLAKWLLNELDKEQ